MEGGLLLLLLSTFHAALHVSVFVSLVSLLSNVGKGSSSDTSPSLLDARESHLKLLGEAQKRGLECVERGSAGPCPEQDPSFVQGLPRKVRKDEQHRGAPE